MWKGWIFFQLKAFNWSFLQCHQKEIHGIYSAENDPHFEKMKWRGKHAKKIETKIQRTLRFQLQTLFPWRLQPEDSARSMGGGSGFFHQTLDFPHGYSPSFCKCDKPKWKKCGIFFRVQLALYDTSKEGFLPCVIFFQFLGLTPCVVIQQKA